VAYDQGPLARSLVAAVQNTGHFHITQHPARVAEGERLLALGQVQFLFAIPPDFSRAVLRGEKPAVLLAVDATDPCTASNAGRPAPVG
jgi:ABC-2 type transport system permease protein